MDIKELETMLLSLLDGEFTSLTIAFNELNAPNYETVRDALERGGSLYETDDWISEEERAAAIAKNSWWRAQWYPRTPVGFNTLAASSLAALVEGLKAEAKEQETIPK